MHILSLSMATVVIFVMMATFFCVTTTTTAVMFNFAEIGPQNHNKDILTDGDGTYISTEGIQLASLNATTSAAGQNQTRAGRATYAELLHLWDAASGQLADFTTNFSFLMNSGGASDGVSFFLARSNYLVTVSGAMGLPVESSSPFVAVEFDTYWNPNWDPVDRRDHDRPIGDHVGINVNSLVSVKVEKWWSNITYGKVCVGKIHYDSASRNLSVYFTGCQNTSIVPDQLEIHYMVDLRNVLPEWVVFGFSSSSSGDDRFQRNSVKSWFFNSTDLHVDQKKRWKKKKKKRVLMRIRSALLWAVLIFLLCLALGGLFIFSRKNRRSGPENDEEGVSMTTTTTTGSAWAPRAFTYQELSIATNNFDTSMKIGVGGFSVVYKATLADGEEVAVKKMSTTSQRGIQQYEAELQIIGGAIHKHLVKLIGWCNEREGQLLIVYELMENKSLDVHLFSSDMALLPWDTRYKIAQGLAKALRYLHEECGQGCVLHRDIKSSNVLLDSDFEAKLGDFGLAILVDHDRSMQLSVLAGTIGYLDPECFNTIKVSKRSDVYSFGVLLLEMATGRRCIDLDAEEEDQKVLVKMVLNLYQADRILEAVDPRLRNDYDKLQMKGLMVLGLWCVHQDYSTRPSIRDIVRALNNTQDPLSDLRQKIPNFETHTRDVDVPAANPPLFSWPDIPLLHRLRFW